MATHTFFIHLRTQALFHHGHAALLDYENHAIGALPTAPAVLYLVLKQRLEEISGHSLSPPLLPRLRVLDKPRRRRAEKCHLLLLLLHLELEGLVRVVIFRRRRSRRRRHIALPWHRALRSESTRNLEAAETRGSGSRLSTVSDCDS